MCPGSHSRTTDPGRPRLRAWMQRALGQKPTLAVVLIMVIISTKSADILASVLRFVWYYRSSAGISIATLDCRLGKPLYDIFADLLILDVCILRESATE